MTAIQEQVVTMMLAGARSDLPLRCLTALLLAYTVVLGDPIKSAAAVDESGSLVGKVLEDSGQVGKIQVQAYAILTNDGHGGLVSRCLTYTDSDGNYQCTRLAPGKYLVAARPVQSSGRSESKDRRSDGSYVLTFYPSTVELDDAVPFRVRHGESAEVDIVMNRAPTYTVKGSLPDRPSQVGLTLVAIGSNGYELGVNQKVKYTAATGEFKTDAVPAGRYLLQGNWLTDCEDHRSVTGHQGTLMITVDSGNIEGVHIPELSLARVEVNVKSRGGNFGILGGLSLEELTSKSTRFVASVAPDGRMLFSAVPAGVYRVELESPGATYIKSITVDGSESDGQRVVVASGRADVMLELELSTSVGTVQGTVKAWDVDDAKSEIVVESSESGQFYHVGTDQQGNFRVTGLGPGDYSLYAWQSLGDIEYANPLFLRRYTLSRTDVSVTEGSASQIELERLDPPP